MAAALVGMPVMIAAASLNLLLVIPVVIILCGALVIMMSFFKDFLGLPEEDPASSPPKPPMVQPGAPTPAAPLPQPTQAFDFEDARIPQAARPKIKETLDLIATIERRISAEGHVDLDTVELRQMRDVHMPNLLKSYFAIAPEHRAEIYKRTGKSASFALVDAVEAVRARVEKMSTKLAEGDIASFTDNLDFINARYKQPEDPFNP